jgi:adenosine deaminase
MRRTVSKNHTTIEEQVAAELNIHLEDPVSTKTVLREFHKSNIHGKIARLFKTSMNPFQEGLRLY